MEIRGSQASVVAGKVGGVAIAAVGQVYLPAKGVKTMKDANIKSTDNKVKTNVGHLKATAEADAGLISIRSLKDGRDAHEHTVAVADLLGVLVKAGVKQSDFAAAAKAADEHAKATAAEAAKLEAEFTKREKAKAEAFKTVPPEYRCADEKLDFDIRNAHR